MAGSAHHDYRGSLEIEANNGSSSQGPVQASAPADIQIMPCALVFIEPCATGSPNCTSLDPLCYVDQAITLNRSLIAAGMPRLIIGTNSRDEIERYLANVEQCARPTIFDLKSSMVLPKTTPFYAAHFKLDLLEQLGRSVPPGTLVLLLDTDMVALRPLEQTLLQRCDRSGVGAFDISDQEFFAYGAIRVISDLEIAAGKRLDNPRWFGGECLLASASFLEKLVPRARECFQRYRFAMNRFNHNGDEAFISAALNLLADDGQQVIDLGANQIVGRHWSGNTHRDLRWFRHCSLLHLPGGKKMLAGQARRDDFKMARIWRKVVVAHAVGKLKVPAKRLLRWKLDGRRQRASASSWVSTKDPRVDVLLVNSDSLKLSLLASDLTSRGISVMCTLDAGEALRAATRMRPRVMVVSNLLTDPNSVSLMESCAISTNHSEGRFLIDLDRAARHIDPTVVDKSHAAGDRAKLVESIVLRAKAGRRQALHHE